MAASGGVGERYATQVGALWSGLARTLAELERLAADPAGLDDEDTLGSLKQLQYRLHLASEQAYGISPPSGVEPVHAELAAALAGARDATAELVEALEEDGRSVITLSPGVAWPTSRRRPAPPAGEARSPRRGRGSR